MLPLHDGQILPTSRAKNDAFQKQRLQMTNCTSFEVFSSFVIGSRFAIIVVAVVVVIVLNYTSPKFHISVGDIYSSRHLSKKGVCI